MASANYNPATGMHQYHNEYSVPHTAPSVPIRNKILTINKHKYQFGDGLGSGGFSTVYTARRYPEKKPVVIKVVALTTMNALAGNALNESIMSEIRMAQRLQKTSKHIIHMYDFDFHPNTGLSFIVMERGIHNLEKELQTSGHLAPAPRKIIWRQLMDIAMTLHSQNIVHLDIKPQNLVMFPNNQVKLIDLGIAKKADTRRREPSGAMLYSAPELVVGSNSYMARITSKADAWSWGAILYRILYSVPPKYNSPCHYPPPGKPPSKDHDLLDLLKHTLVGNAEQRVDIPWMSAHKYTVAH